MNHFDDDIQLSTQNNIIFQNISKTLADCYINCTVYNDLQLFYKEKVKKISFIPKGLPIVNRWKFVANRLHVQQKAHSDTVLYSDLNPLNKFCQRYL